MLKLTVPHTLIALAALAAGLASLVGPRVVSANGITVEGCIQAKSSDLAKNHDYLLVKAGDNSLLEINVDRGKLSKEDREKSLEANNCWEFDVELSGKPVIVFLDQATYAGDGGDIGDYKDETNLQQGKEPEREKNR